jgi:hypothetical protein
MGKIYDKASYIVPMGAAYTEAELWAITNPSITDNGKMTFDRNGITHRTTNCNIEEIASDIPRIDYENGYSHISMQAENQNLLTYSEFSTGWTNGASTTTLNAGVSPDGHINAAAIQVNGAGTYNESSLRRSAGSQSAGYYVYSVYLKALNDLRYVSIQIWTGSNATDLVATFDLVDGKKVTGAGSFPDNGEGKIQELSDGWYRVSVSGNIASSATLTQYIYLREDTSILGVSDFNDNGVYAFGAMLERVAPYSTSYPALPSAYIKTTSATVSQVRDQSYISTFTPESDRVTVYGWIRLRNEWGNVAVEQDNNYNIFGFVNGTTDQYGLYYWRGDGDKFGFNTWNNDSYGISGSTIHDGEWHKVVVVFDFNNFTQGKLFIDGVKQTISQTRGTTVQRSQAPFALSSPTTSNQSPVCDYREVVVFDQGLPDDECITLSTL